MGEVVVGAAVVFAVVAGAYAVFAAIATLMGGWRG